MQRAGQRHSWQFVIGGLALFTIAAYVLSWKDVPIIFDEAAFRRLYGRAFIDGFVQYPVFPACTTPDVVPAIFVPAHALLSWLDGMLSWSGVRIIPMAALAGMIATTTLLMRRQSTAWGYGLAVLCGGFVGLGGVGLVLSRWEYIATLHITVCMLTWLVARRGPASNLVIGALLVLNLLIILLSLFVHPQGLLVMPLSLLACLYLLRGRPLASLASAVLLVGLGVFALNYGEFRCPEDPTIVAAMEKTQGVVLGNELAPLSRAERIVRRLMLFERHFLLKYEPEYAVPAPSLGKPVALALMPPVATIVALNLVGIAFGAVWAFYLLLKDYRPELLGRRWGDLYNALITDGRVFWLAGAVLVLLYSVVDIAGVFYRAHYRNFLSAVLLAFAIAYVLDTRNATWAKIWAAATLSTAAMSAVAAWLFLAPQLAAGYESSYVSLRRNWPAQNTRIRALAAQCGIKPGDGQIVVDVATYDALREYPRPIDFNYVWYGEYLKGEQKTRTEQEWLEYYKQHGTSGYVVMCRTLNFAKLPVQKTDGEFCCMKF